jgi:hypothetical protein
MPGAWAAATGVFFVWGTVTTILYATKETDDEVPLHVTDLYVARSDIIDMTARTGLCFDIINTTWDGVEIDYLEPEHHIVEYMDADGQKMDLYFNIRGYAMDYYDNGFVNGACDNYTNYEDKVVHTLLLETDEADGYNVEELRDSIYRIECVEGDVDCTILSLSESGDQVTVLENFLESKSVAVTGGIGVASVIGGACNRTILEDGVFRTTDHPCPCQRTTDWSSKARKWSKKKVKGVVQNADKINEHGLKSRNYWKGCTVRPTDSSKFYMKQKKYHYPDTHPLSVQCKDCADDVNCAYYIDIKVGKNDGCYQTDKNPDDLPVCWADMCPSSLHGRTGCRIGSTHNRGEAQRWAREGYKKHFCEVYYTHAKAWGGYKGTLKGRKYNKGKRMLDDTSNFGECSTGISFWRQSEYDAACN